MFPQSLALSSTFSASGALLDTTTHSSSNSSSASFTPSDATLASGDFTTGLRKTINTIRTKLLDRVGKGKQRCETLSNCIKDSSIEYQSTSNQDGHQRMSESERIAFDYRASSASTTQLDSYLQAPSDCDINDSCPDMCPGGDSNLRRTARVYDLHDMLSLAKVPQAYDIQTDDEILRSYRRFPENITLPSSSPSQSPHIVITPPCETETLQAFYSAFVNQPPLQHALYLQVPPLSLLTSRALTHDEWCAIMQPPQQCQPFLEAKIVFNRVRFNQWLEATKHDGTYPFLREVLRAITRHSIRIAAEAASLAAQRFRARYDIDGFAESLERPYKWTDPAEALLELSRRHPVGFHHFPSENPFLIPHIVVEQCWSNDSAIIEASMLPPQDWNSGNTLTVPSCFSPLASYDDHSDQDLDSESDGEEYWSDTCSSYSRPQTPTLLEEAPPGYFNTTTLEGELAEDGSRYPTLGTEEWIEENSLKVKDRFHLDEDDDDGPPPIDDDWFVSIQRRSIAT